MVVHWEELDAGERDRWLSLTAEANLASYRQAVDRLEKANKELSRFAIIFHPFKLLFSILEQIRMVRLLTRFRRAFRDYEKSIVISRQRPISNSDKDRPLLIAFPNRTLTLELERRGSEQLQKILRDIANV